MLCIKYFSGCKCQRQSEIVSVAQSPRERKTVGRQTVVAIAEEKTSGREMSLDADGRQAEKGKTGHSQWE